MSEVISCCLVTLMGAACTHASPSLHVQVKTRDESRGVGRISKQWSGLLKEILTDTDNFGIQFPMDLDVKIKAVLLGACFLIVSLNFQIMSASWWRPSKSAEAGWLAVAVRAFLGHLTFHLGTCIWKCWGLPLKLSAGCAHVLAMCLDAEGPQHLSLE